MTPLRRAMWTIAALRSHVRVPRTAKRRPFRAFFDLRLGQVVTEPTFDIAALPLVRDVKRCRHVAFRLGRTGERLVQTCATSAYLRLRLLRPERLLCAARTHTCNHYNKRSGSSARRPLLYAAVSCFSGPSKKGTHCYSMP